MCTRRSSTPLPTRASGKFHSPRPDEAARRREPLRPVASTLRNAGYNTVHVTDVGLANTDDDVILRSAADAGRIIVTADADFGALLALRRDRRPSVLMLRSSGRLNPDQQAELILATLARSGTNSTTGLSPG